MRYTMIHKKRWEKIRVLGKKRYVIERVLATEIGILLGFILSFLYGVLDDKISYVFILQVVIFSSVIFTFIYYRVFAFNENGYKKLQ